MYYTVLVVPAVVPLPGHLSPAVLLLQSLVQTHSSVANLGCHLNKHSIEFTPTHLYRFTH